MALDRKNMIADVVFWKRENAEENPEMNVRDGWSGNLRERALYM